MPGIEREIKQLIFFKGVMPMEVIVMR